MQKAVVRKRESEDSFSGLLVESGYFMSCEPQGSVDISEAFFPDKQIYNKKLHQS